MKIAVMSIQYGSHQGGSYTYERSILTAAASTIGQADCDTVVVLAPTSPPPWWPKDSRVSWIPFATTIAHKILAIPFALRQYLVGRSAAQTMRDAHGRHINRCLTQHQVDMVWQISPGYPPLDVPYIATLWDLQHREQPWFPETSSGNEWWNREEYYAEWLGRAMRIIVPNSVARTEVERAYGISSDRIVEIAQPVDPFNDVAAERSQTAAAEHGYQLIYPAQFWPHKNHVCLLEALRELRHQHDHRWRLVFTGSDKGTAGYVLSESQRMGVADAVDFRGFVSREALVELYRESFAMLFPSFFGPENLPPLEAMSFGCPVVAAAVPGASEQLRDACLLFDPLDPGALASNVARLKAEPELRRLIVAKGLTLAATHSAASVVERAIAVAVACRGFRQAWPGSWSR